MPKKITVDTEKMINIMSRLDFFENFSKLDLRRMLIRETDVFLFDKAELILRKGKSDYDFYILLSGSVSIVTDNNIVNRINAGSFFGEMSFLTHEPRSANVIANEDALVMKIDNAVMERLHLSVKNKIKDKIIHRLIDNIKKMNILLDDKSGRK